VVRRLVGLPLAGNARELRNIIRRYMFDRHSLPRGKSRQPGNEPSRADILMEIKRDLHGYTPGSRASNQDIAKMLSVLGQVADRMQQAGLQPRVLRTDLEFIFGWSKPTAWRWLSATQARANLNGPNSAWIVTEAEHED